MKESKIEGGLVMTGSLGRKEGHYQRTVKLKGNEMPWNKIRVTILQQSGDSGALVSFSPDGENWCDDLIIFDSVLTSGSGTKYTYRVSTRGIRIKIKKRADRVHYVIRASV